ncbi:outer membrane beta-barrel protein [Hymenobacter sp. BT186]|uniref:Outer membrane beta-barrel protein n=1 Tax=Hymenobacter telluris TaxID=2816474 RepID=A0A939EU01_9BACT|nr:TonB-dependent receptor [Hymenobacter telluris]MBO0356946.1 outer membrane beta-barrel protein [Hymenobacter telluris]MBW3372973.1 TonB-dependent receptor [Hymenobacter norwichensis]
MNLILTRFLTLLLFLLASSSAIWAQTGTIKGTVKDATTQEPIIGASVGVPGTSIGAATDLDGNFTLNKVPVATYSLVINSVSYSTKTIPGLQVESGKVVVVNTQLNSSSAALGEVVVTAQRRTNTEVAVISEVRNAQLVAVGVSSEQIVKSQDRDAAQIARRVPGVSIQDNRFVLVRGLVQRYNAVMLNDVMTPSSEVDTRAFAFDMIPSSVIDRMMIFKSGSAELPGDFAGGVIKVYTKRAPEENFTSFSVQGGYRNGTTFKDVQKYEGGKYDWLGFDSGKRTIPDNWPGKISRDLPLTLQAAYGRQLPNNWAVRSAQAAPDLRLSFSMGRRFELGEKQVGTLTSLNYGNYHVATTPNLTFYTLGDDPKATNAEYQDQAYNNEVRLGVVQNFWLRLNSHSTLEFKNLFNQLGAAETVVREGEDKVASNESRSYSERFESRSIYSGQLIGNHELPNDKTTVNWVGGFAYTHRTEPDWRRVRYLRPLGGLDTDGSPAPFGVATGAQPVLTDASRYFSKLNERVESAALNVVHQFTTDSTNKEGGIKLKAGLYAERKDRDFSARWFGYTNVGNTGATGSGTRLQPVDQVFSNQNLTGQNGGFALQEGTDPNDVYDASNTLAAGYASLTLPLGKFTGVAGFRGEYNDQVVNNQFRGGGTVKGGQRLFSPLPSLNLSYNLTDKMLMRAAYASTINRPEFRELSTFRFYDFNLNADVQGNASLKTAKVQNLDLRWEMYPSTGEQITLGGFYKHFNDPIETFMNSSVGGANVLGYSSVNTQSATSYGVEAEVRKSLAGISASRWLERLSFVGNFSYIYSRVELGEYVMIPDASGQVKSTYVGDTQTQRRPLQGQSPYLINLGAYYNDDERGTQLSLLYNVVGPRIFAVGNVDNPTLFEVPRNVLDLVLTKRLAKHWELRAAWQDIFNQPVQLVQDLDRNNKYSNNDGAYRSFRRGSSTTLGLNFNW